MRNCILALGLIGCALACGDNTKACGPGTVDDNGTCVPVGGCGFGTKPDEVTGQCVPDPSACGEGTIFDPVSGTCKIDPASCHNGTVLINNECVDPAAGLVIDVQEGPEPNGMGIVEASLAQAGNVTLKPPGAAYVMHGTLQPWRDANGDGALDPDVDTYVVQVSKPVVLELTADGLAGVLAGFVAVAAVPPGDELATWRRFGIHVTGDLSRRQVLLPRAGTYRIAIGDARTLADYAATGTSTSVVTGEYYVSINDLGTPVATPLTASGGVATLTAALPADTLGFYTLAMGTGLNAVSATMPSPLATASAVVINNNAFRGVADEPGRLLAGNISPSDAPLVVVDHVINTTAPNMDFTLSITLSTAVPLGGVVSAASTATATTASDLTKLTLFSIETPAMNSSLALQLAWSPQVIGQLYDGSGRVAATFTTPTTTATWSSYRGILRLAEPGRYYFAVRSANPNTITATSTLVQLTPPPITLGMPGATGLNAVRVEGFTYTVGSVPWQQFDVTGTNTGGQSVVWLDPGFAFGRLDSVATSTGTLAGECPPVFAHSYPTGGGAIGRVMLDDPASYYVKVAAVSPTTSPAIVIDFRTRAAAQDLGTIASSLALTGETIDPATPSRYYLFRAASGASVTITVTPTSSVNTQFRRLRADETALGALINNATGPDVESFTQTGGWTAFVVSSATSPSAARTYDLSVVVQ